MDKPFKSPNNKLFSYFPRHAVGVINSLERNFNSLYRNINPCNRDRFLFHALDIKSFEIGSQDKL